ncbi:hypothetical protein WOLCODRAFT_99424 [Wolfiporia cocos MD-104 SS10]|uniref:MutL C-terminal dimerisation domain-containing protein n=1 Tax=Wolfiporia cocos (strain MD-104) TaxID=742152 RepID=A0A2H3JLW5_WOLCO|nr:hypothetical protein WOLCODRAFT_99424 [Wolfiporia cocos MD-104 SS10]
MAATAVPPSSRGAIEHLPPATRSKLRSTQILISLPLLISELVQNSLDAGALHVDVGVDCEEWSCWVRDDGTGISRDGFDVLAGQPEVGRYGTSKAYTPASLDEASTFGFRGEALASAADLSCLEISSRTARSYESWSVILKGGETLYNGPSIRWRRESPGTVVSVRDAFYNLPIRRLSHPSSSKAIELIKRDIETFALMFAHVCFSLEDTNKSKESGLGKGRVLTVPKTASTLATFRHLYGRALTEHVDDVSETSGELRLEGFISLDGAQSKAHQFLYINRHLIAPCDLHRTIDAKFAASTFAKHAFDEVGETSQLRSNARRSPRKAEKRPVYVLNMTIPTRHVDNCMEPAKTAVKLQNNEAAVSFLGSVIEAFLVRHGFSAPKIPRQRTSQSDASDALTTPLRKRRRIEQSVDDTAGPSRGQKPSGIPQSMPGCLIVHPEQQVSQDDSAHLVWTDPATGEAFMVDRRTGNSYPVHEQSPLEQGDSSASWTQRRRTLAPSSRQEGRMTGESVKDIPDWIRDALDTNATYAIAEQRIRSLTLAADFASSGRHDCHQSSSYSHSMADNWNKGSNRRTLSGKNAVPLDTCPGRFARENLQNATVLGQVDRKFVACVIDTEEDRPRRDSNGKSKALVLIDQHAADERIRVEQFLEDLCAGFLQRRPSLNPPRAGDEPDASETSVRELDPPIPVLLTVSEVMQLAQEEVRGAFDRWGIAFGSLEEARLRIMDAQDRYILGNNREAAEGTGYVQVFVKSIPETVGDKLLSGDELRDLVKGYLAKLQNEGIPPAIERIGIDPDDAFVWQSAMRWCPRELLGLVNSKACRGAIMFNDSLTIEQCQRLVKQLAKTALPFQCAHGRPSLVPLADLGADAADSACSGSRRSNVVDWLSFGSE